MPYGLRAYIDSRFLLRGEVGFLIDEYDANKNWVSSKWLGAVQWKNVIDEAFRYTPTSNAVKYSSVQIYMTQSTYGYVYLDNIELFTAAP